MKNCTLVLFYYLFGIIQAQVNFSGSLVSNFGNSQNNFNFFENRVNINSDWKSWSTWIELEHSNPPEIGKQNIGLRKFRLEYQNDIFAFKVGDIYEYWGNGLILNMLDEMIIIIDPLMNPDGRARFAKNLEQYRGTAPNYDDQSLLHTGDWPYGRTNHYYFDLNRDWLYLTQPETQGRVALINQWRPQILVDGHEMGSQDTFMTGPPREPINKNIDTDLIKWGNVFAQDQATAFDENNWRFYTCLLYTSPSPRDRG